MKNALILVFSIIFMVGCADAQTQNQNNQEPQPEVVVNFKKDSELTDEQKALKKDFEEALRVNNMSQTWLYSSELDLKVASWAIAGDGSAVTQDPSITSFEKKGDSFSLGRWYYQNRPKEGLTSFGMVVGQHQMMFDPSEHIGSCEKDFVIIMDFYRNNQIIGCYIYFHIDGHLGRGVLEGL